MGAQQLKSPGSFYLEFLLLNGSGGQKIRPFISLMAGMPFDLDNLKIFKSRHNFFNGSHQFLVFPGLPVQNQKAVGITAVRKQSDGNIRVLQG